MLNLVKASALWQIVLLWFQLPKILVPEGIRTTTFHDDAYLSAMLRFIFYHQLLLTEFS